MANCRQTGGKICRRCRWHRWQICRRCHWYRRQRCRWYRWCTFTCEYLSEFSKKFETVLMGNSGAGGKLIHEKNQKQQISWHCPFKMNLNLKWIYIYVNSRTQRCSNEIIKIFLIEDFFHLPPVSATLVVNLELRISPRIFEKIRNGPNRILWGWGETDWWKKPRKWKISWHSPFKLELLCAGCEEHGVGEGAECGPPYRHSCGHPDSSVIYLHKILGV